MGRIFGSNEDINGDEKKRRTSMRTLWEEFLGVTSKEFRGKEVKIKKREKRFRRMAAGSR